MGNKSAQKVPVNKERFMEILKLRNSSIRKLGEAYEEIERTEKTIRRCLDAGEMPPDLLNRIASIGVQGVQTRLKRNVRFESK